MLTKKEELVDNIGIDQYVETWQIRHFDGTLYQKKEMPLARAILYGETCSREFIIRRSDHNNRIVWSNAAPVLNDKGEITAGIIVFLDITERKQAEEGVKVGEARYRTLAENLPDMVVRYDKKHRFVYVSSNIFTFLGKKAEEFIGKTHDDLEIGFSKKQVRLIEKKTQAIFDTAEAQEIEIYSDNRSERRFFNLRLKPEFDAAGNVEYALGIARDITESIHAKEKEKKQEQQFIQADKMISLGVLVSGVAHEINNPNYAIISHISPLKKIWDDVVPILDDYQEQHGEFELSNMDYSKLRTEMSEIFSTMAENSDRIKNIVEELKQFAQERPEEHIELIQFNRIVQSAINLTKSMINKSTNHFSVNLGEDLPLIRGHYQKLEQVIINLIQNSCQALSGTGESVNISTYHDSLEGTIVFKIMDEGVGIPPELLNRVTDLFYTTKRDIGGIGLGLSISSKLVMEHGGSLEFVPGLERGAIVTVSIPLESSKKYKGETC
jgi:PAS domain S-box-containing protein